MIKTVSLEDADFLRSLELINWFDSKDLRGSEAVEAMINTLLEFHRRGNAETRAALERCFRETLLFWYSGKEDEK